MAYDLFPLKAPRTAGWSLRLLVWLVNLPLVGQLLSEKFYNDMGIYLLRKEAVHMDLPMSLKVASSDPHEGTYAPIRLTDLVEVKPPTSDQFWPETAGDFHRAYLAGNTDPEEVAERIISATLESEKMSQSMGIFISQDSADIRKQAAESAERYRQGQVLSPLDGVPIAVKDELDMTPYPTTVGTRIYGQKATTEDATVVSRLRENGALLIGKTNMQEIGLGVTGLNPHHGPARNPYDPDRATGGSSSGSAAAVAAGLCPIAVGADGGGSIRIPASLCGLVGLKPTFGRVSEHGASPLCWSVAHVGPIASTTLDCALAYGVMAGADPADINSTHQPLPHLDEITNTDLTGVKLGMDVSWFEDADSQIVSSCKCAITRLESLGAEVVPLKIDNLALLRITHLVTIASEMAASQQPLFPQQASEYGHDVQLNLTLTRFLKNTDYIQAQRHRVGLTHQFLKHLQMVDCIVTPATGRTAPIHPRDALKTGESNLTVTDQIMRFSPPANLTGLPAISVPVGYDDQGLPIGLQFIGRAWAEHTLLRLSFALEQENERVRPQVHYSILND
jgi:Asp-tRNA(Asn)/Glu-tRNA(Gln) amidotransferase A subunit family amidase